MCVFAFLLLVRQEHQHHSHVYVLSTELEPEQYAASVSPQERRDVV